MTTAEAIAIANEVRSRRSVVAKMYGRLPTTFEQSTPAGSQLDKLHSTGDLAKIASLHAQTKTELDKAGALSKEAERLAAEAQRKLDLLKKFNLELDATLAMPAPDPLQRFAMARNVSKATEH